MEEATRNAYHELSAIEIFKSIAAETHRKLEHLASLSITEFERVASEKDSDFLGENDIALCAAKNLKDRLQATFSNLNAKLEILLKDNGWN